MLTMMEISCVYTFVAPQNSCTLRIKTVQVTEKCTVNFVGDYSEVGLLLDF